jgi:hypothetical protein
MNNLTEIRLRFLNEALSGLTRIDLQKIVSTQAKLLSAFSTIIKNDEVEGDICLSYVQDVVYWTAHIIESITSVYLEYESAKNDFTELLTTLKQEVENGK